MVTRYHPLGLATHVFGVLLPRRHLDHLNGRPTASSKQGALGALVNDFPEVGIGCASEPEAFAIVKEIARNLVSTNVALFDDKEHPACSHRLSSFRPDARLQIQAQGWGLS
jgi:hypothetical protein